MAASFLLPLLVAPVMAQAPPLYVNVTLGQCFSPYVFNLVVNTASSAALVGHFTYANTTMSFASENNETDAGDFRLQLETGTQVTTIIVLFVILAISLLLLVAGEAFVNTVAVLTTVLISFMGFLYLWQWACSSTVLPMEGWVKCILPFILACVSALIITAIVICMMKKFTSLVFFIMGAAGGAVGMFMLRQIILAADSGLALDPLFNLYWLALAAVALVGGILALCFKSLVVKIVTCVLGGYAFAVALCGLIPAFGGPFVPNYGFFITAGCAIVIGFLIQCFCCKKRPKKEEELHGIQYQVEGKGKKGAKGQPAISNNEFIRP